MICWVLTGCFTSILLSCSVASYLAACILRARLSIYFYLRWPNEFWTKINKIFKREFLGVSKETSPILDPRTWASCILKWRGENLGQFVKKWVRKIKIIGVVKRYVLTQELANIFENICIFLLRFIQSEHFLN